MQRFTELYKDDAERLALYFSKRDDIEIVMITEKGADFPTPPKMRSMPDMVNAYKVGYYEIAYLENERPEGEDLKYKDRNLARVMIGDKIRQLRKQRGITLDELAEKSGIKAGNIANIEAGRFNVAIDTLSNLCDAMDFDMIFMPK